MEKLDLPLEIIVTRLPHWGAVHFSTLSRYETGHYVPALGILCALAIAYELTTGELLRAFEEDMKALLHL